MDRKPQKKPCYSDVGSGIYQPHIQFRERIAVQRKTDNTDSGQAETDAKQGRRSDQNPIQSSGECSGPLSTSQCDNEKKQLDNGG